MARTRRVVGAQPGATEPLIPPPLDGLADVLRAATARVEKRNLRGPAAARARILAAIQSAREALPAAAALMAASPPEAPNPTGDARSAWLHALREPVNGMVSWVHVLSRTHSDETWTRAACAIDHSAESLVRLLRQPPDREP